jgi:sarcosine oxidase
VSEFDVIVVGLGAMGSATAFQLARRGTNRVLGLDAFQPGHLMGSSHGETRIIRMAYHEHPDYVPLLRRAYALWKRTEVESGVELLRITGGIFAGPIDGDIVAGSLRSARAHGLSHSLLDAAQIHKLFPVLRPRADDAALYEDAAGLLFPEKCVAAHLTLAEQHGAILQHGTPVQSIEERNGETIVRTERETHTAGAVVVTLGAWVRKLLPEVPVTAERIPLMWFEPVAQHEQFELGRFPIVIWQSADLGEYYLTPHVEIPGVKTGKHHSNDACDPATVNREATADDERPLRAFLERHIPSLLGAVSTTHVCMYENSPDLHFLVERQGNLVIGAGFSGHGFKFASVIGEVLADLAIDGKTVPEADFLRFSRLSSGSAATS